MSVKLKRTPTTYKGHLMPDIQTELINRLQSQMGTLVAQCTLKDIQLEIVVEENSNLKNMLEQAGQVLPESQVARIDGNDQDSGDSSGGSTSGSASPNGPEVGSISGF